jgi:16S rRNA (cytidine1402-2'-O)-methyltransferase
MTQPSDLSCDADAAPASPTQTAWARQAAQVSAQQWPAPALYVVATPIGNLGDMSLRAVSALQQASAIAVEDTRTTRPLLDAWGINTPLITAHRHNEAQAAAGIVARLQAGERVALVSDAGTPAVSDPGAHSGRQRRNGGTDGQRQHLRRKPRLRVCRLCPAQERGTTNLAAALVRHARPGGDL